MSWRSMKNIPNVHTRVSATTPIASAQWISFHSLRGGKVLSVTKARIEKPTRMITSAPRPASRYSSPSWIQGWPIHQPAWPCDANDCEKMFHRVTATSA